MTMNNDSKQLSAIGDQLLQLFAAYDALHQLLQITDSERALFTVLNCRFLAILDEADEVGILS